MDLKKDPKQEIEEVARAAIERAHLDAARASDLARSEIANIVAASAALPNLTFSDIVAKAVVARTEAFELAERTTMHAWRLDTSNGAYPAWTVRPETKLAQGKYRALLFILPIIDE